MKTISKHSTAPAEDDYLDLVREFPLRRIRTEKEHAAARKALSPLMDRSTRQPSGLTAGEAEYAEALATLIHAFEKPVRDAIVARATPVERLRHYMEARDLRSKDIAEHVGGKSAASLILNGKRQISREQAKALAALFDIDAGKFL